MHSGLNRNLPPSIHPLGSAATLAQSPPSDRLFLLEIGPQGLIGHRLPAAGSIDIGSAASCGVCLGDATVARRHLRLRIDDELTLCEDQTTNGTKISGVPLAPGQSVALALGEVIEIGETKLLLRKARLAARSSSAPMMPAMARACALLDKVALSNMSVLLTGETGVGKEVAAERIHRASPRADKPMVRINCATLSESLFETELFGHERGAFTGAAHAKAGLLETADGGTVFLDEIGELKLGLQCKLLRVLERQTLTRVGGVEPITLDLRFIAATNRDLKEMAKTGAFRTGLYYRLAAMPVAIPPLRHRLDELPALVEQFVLELSPPGRVYALRSDFLEGLRRRSWPGNIRELRNLVARALALADGELLGSEHLQVDENAALPMQGSDKDRDELLSVLLRCGWNQSRAALELGIARGTLRARMDSLDLRRPHRAKRPLEH